MRIPQINYFKMKGLGMEVLGGIECHEEAEKLVEGFKLVDHSSKFTVVGKPGDYSIFMKEKETKDEH